MKLNIRIHCGIILTAVFATLLLAIATTSAHASESSKNGDWQYGLMIYGWLPSIDGKLKYDIPDSGTDAGVDAGDILNALDMVFMGAFEARKGKWSILVDLVYLALSEDKNESVNVAIGTGVTIDTATSAKLEGWLISVGGAYNVLQTDKGKLAILLGARYFSVDTDLELKIDGPLPAGLSDKKLSKSTELWDGILGVRGDIALGDKWYLPYHLDIGAGASEFTWQALAGIGYRFKWGDILLAYRYLSYDEGDDSLLQELSFGGPLVGVKFNF